MLQSFMENIRVLIVEDDEIARENAVEYLEDRFSHIYEAKDCLEALKVYEKNKPEIIICDIQMPKINGLEFIEKIREVDNKTHIIITSAYSTKEYLLKAIELKLVKYLVKPIKQNELDEALNLCVNELSEKPNFKINENFSFNFSTKTLYKNEKVVKLRTKELLLLELLIKYKNRFVTYEELELFIWGEDFMSKDALKTLIKNIKNIIGKEIIKNLSGTGYKIEC